jgi:Right handed beta helix region
MYGRIAMFGCSLFLLLISPGASELASSMALSFDVKTYGAIGNGSTDDHTAVQNAITAAGNAGGGVVLFPSGATFNLGTTTVTIPAGVQVQIAGNLTVGANPAFRPVASNIGIACTSNATITLSRKNASFVAPSGTISNLTVQGCKVVGSGVVADAQQGIYNNSGQTLSNIKYLNNTISGVIVGISLNADLSGSISGGLIQGNHLSNIVGTTSGTGYGIHHANGSGNASQVKIIGNHIDSAHRHAIYQAKGSGVTIANNTIRLHRIGDTAAGSPRAAIECIRSTDVTISSNVIDSPNDAAIEAAPADGFPSRNITIVGNVISHATGVWPEITLGSTGPALDGVGGDYTVEGNTIHDSGHNPPALGIQSGKRINIIGNFFYKLAVTNTASVIQIRGIGETYGSATYSDQLMFKNNYIYGTEAGGGALYGFEFYSTAAISGIRADFISNRVNTPHNGFLFDATQTNANIRVVNVP